MSFVVHYTDADVVSLPREWRDEHKFHLGTLLDDAGRVKDSDLFIPAELVSPWMRAVPVESLFRMTKDSFAPSWKTDDRSKICSRIVRLETGKEWPVRTTLCRVVDVQELVNVYQNNHQFRGAKYVVAAMYGGVKDGVELPLAFLPVALHFHVEVLKNDTPWRMPANTDSIIARRARVAGGADVGDIERMQAEMVPATTTCIPSSVFACGLPLSTLDRWRHQVSYEFEMPLEMRTSEWRRLHHETFAYAFPATLYDRLH